MSKIVVFGYGTIAETAYFYLTNDSPHDIAAFTADGNCIKKKELFGLPVIPFEEVENKYPPDEFKMFIAVAYQNLNKLRAAKCREAKDKGYNLITYVSSRACNVGKVETGDNCFILENAVIQPGSKIGDDVFIWSGNHIGHHSTVGDHCYISGQVIIGGHTTIEPYCFIGVNATIGHGVTIRKECFIGAGSLITKRTEPNGVYITQDTPRYRLDSRSFLKITKL